jgi:electron-transferring-flavoprotein dehydrogenase
LIGCAAGFVNVPRIKGSHNAILSGMLAADAAFNAIALGRAGDVLNAYDEAFLASAVYRDLKRVRNVKPLWSRYGTALGVPLGAFDMWANQLLGFSPFGTVRVKEPDYAQLKPAKAARPMAYPRPDGVVTFDKLSSVFLSGNTT